MSGQVVREQAVRFLVLGVPDWPLVATGVPPEEPAVVLRANRVRAASAAARAAGIRSGLRQRDAQARCPEVVVMTDDPARDVRAFEPVVTAVADLCPQLAVFRPGWCGFPTRGPSRYFGGDEALAVRVRQVASDVVAAGTAPAPAQGEVQVGVADGRFAAELAATTGPSPLVVPPGASARWLAPLPVAALARQSGEPEGQVPADLVDLLRQLGLATLGDVAGVPAGDLVARFGPDGSLVHRLASGLDNQPTHLVRLPEDLALEAEFDPPLDRVDQLAFAVRPLAEELHQTLEHQGEMCTRLVVVAETDHGERRERGWRHGFSLTADAMAERIRWQLDSWLQEPAADRPTAGIVRLRLVAEEVVAATGTQLTLWDAAGLPSDRVLRAVARLGRLVGPDAVNVPRWQGGRHPTDQVALAPAQNVDLAGSRTPPSRTPPSRTPPSRTPPPAGPAGPGRPPWPGHLPVPSPSTVLADTDRVPVEVLDAAGTPVTVSGRAVVSAPPAELCFPEGSSRRRRQRITGWAGPWPVVERWWEAARRRRLARFQVTAEDGSAYLLVLDKGRWLLAASYD